MPEPEPHCHKGVTGMANRQGPAHMKILKLRSASRAFPLCTAILMAAVAWSDAAHAAAASVCEREMIAAAQATGVPLGVLLSVGVTETGHKGVLQPYALNIEGKTVIARSQQEAVDYFRKARGKGKILIDLGCMQVNHHYHGGNFASVEAMLDPHQNVTYAAQFLKRLREQEGNWTMAVARYHAGPNNNPAQKRYICAVIRNLVATGFGNWTENARAFCR